MNKFKITVETKSRSKVVFEFGATETKSDICETIVEGFREAVLQIDGAVFNTANVNYISVEEVE